MGLVGRKIVSVRHISKPELDFEGWEEYNVPTTIIELDDGTLIYPSQDEEGNGPGVLFTRKGDSAGLLW